MATFNLAWLFDGVSDPSGSIWLGNPTGAQTHIDKVAEQILRADADIYAVHEVESCTVLATLITKLPGYKGYLVQVQWCLVVFVDVLLVLLPLMLAAADRVPTLPRVRTRRSSRVLTPRRHWCALRRLRTCPCPARRAA